MKQYIFLLFITLVFSVNSNACLNYYYTTDSDGHTHVLEERIPAFNINFNHRLIDRKLGQLLQEMEDEASFQKLSDYAVLLMKAGKVDIALDLLQQIAMLYPNEYRIAANLGTAYELSGELDSALFYIRKGVELNPNAHDGSEWVHIRILETKKALQKDSNYLSENSVLNLSEDAIKNEATADQLLIQLQERFPFMPNHDPIMADLFYDLGRCFMASKSLRYAERFFELSYKYYGGNENIAKNKIEEVKKLKLKNDHITPNENEVYHGDLSRLSIRYKDLFDDNNNPPHQIDWTKFNLNSHDLLAMNNLPFVPIENKKGASITETNTESDSTETIQESSIDNMLSKSTNNTLLFTFIVALSLILIAVYFIRKGKK